MASGFWSSETMHARLPALIPDFQTERVKNGAYELAMGPESKVTGEDSHTKTTHPVGEAVVILPGQFAQLLTEEVVTVPNDALGLISMKSKWKTLGLINVSGFHVDPGYSGRLLFAVYNAGPNTITISRGAPAFLIWYASLDQPTADEYKGGRQGFTSMTDADVMALQGEVWSPHALADRLRDLDAARLDAEELDKRVRALETAWDASKKIAGFAVAVILLLVGAFFGGLFDSDDDGGSSDERDMPTTTVEVPADSSPDGGPASSGAGADGE